MRFERFGFGAWNGLHKAQDAFGEFGLIWFTV
jgi:hypothetical protein